MKTLLITTTTLLAAALAGTTHAGIINGDFSSTALTQGNGDITSLDQGWYANKPDDGVLSEYNWSTGLSAGEADGVLTKVNTKGVARIGQFFSSDEFEGTGFSLTYDLGGTGTGSAQIQLWGGTLDDSPSGDAVIVGGGGAPSSNIVDGVWTELLFITENSGGSNGPKSHVITQDLSSYDVMVIRLLDNTNDGQGVGRSYDNFAIVPEPSSLALLGLGGLCILRRRRG